MSETTEGKSIPEALRMVADWLDDGRVVECRSRSEQGWEATWFSDRHHGKDDSAFFYRAKPRKPRKVLMIGSVMSTVGERRPTKLIPEGTELIELTDEVKEAIDKAGIKYD